ncbi:MAG TPA: MFS transporter [Nevskiaceae bacterium]|nr:MFS transporter [Nevskiaceae bacterium]
MNSGVRSAVTVIVAASVVSTIGDLPFNALPLLLGSLAEGFHLSPQVLGFIGSTCFAGYLAGTLAAPLWINRFNWRVVAAGAALLTAASFAVAARIQMVAWLYPVWAAIGFFSATLTCLGMRVLADLPNKVRAYGVRQGIELAITALVLFVLPPLIIAVWHYPGAAFALAGVVLLLGLSARWVPAKALAEVASTGHDRRWPTRAAVVLLAVYLVFLTGNIGLWAFLERMGNAQHVTAEQMGLLFAVLKLLGGVAAFSVAGLGERLGERLPHLLVFIGIGAGVLLLASHGGFTIFALGAWLWDLSFTCGAVFQTAAIARSDASGRGVMLVPAVFAASSMIGPGFAGTLVQGGGFGVLLMLVAAASVVPLIFYGLGLADGTQRHYVPGRT